MSVLSAGAGLAVRMARGITSNVLTATDGRDVLSLNSPDGWEVEQPWLWWSGNGSSVFGNPIPGANGAAGGGLPAVARCTSLIADTLGGLPWKVMRGREQLSTPDWLVDPQALRLDGRVVDADSVDDVRLSGMDFWSQALTSMLWYGDAFVYVPRRDAGGQPLPPLWLLHPDDVRIENQAYFVGGEQLPASELIHLRGQPPIVGGRGTGVIARFAKDLGLAAQTREYASGLYTSGVPAGYLKVSQPGMTQEAADKLKASWMRAHGSSQRSIAVLNAVTDFTALQLSPVDAQLVEMRRLSLLDIALMFGVPPYLLGAPADSATYANIESRMMEFAMFTLMPWARRVESPLDAQLPRGTSVKVDLRAMMRADTSARIASYTAGLTQGFYTVDEVRAMEDLPPLEEGAAL